MASLIAVIKDIRIRPSNTETLKRTSPYLNTQRVHLMVRPRSITKLVSPCVRNFNPSTIQINSLLHTVTESRRFPKQITCLKNLFDEHLADGVYPMFFQPCLRCRTYYRPPCSPRPIRQGCPLLDLHQPLRPPVHSIAQHHCRVVSIVWRAIVPTLHLRRLSPTCDLLPLFIPPLMQRAATTGRKTYPALRRCSCC